MPRIREAVNFPKIEGIEHFSEILEKREQREKLTKKDLEEFSRLKTALQRQSQELMAVLGVEVGEMEAGSSGEDLSQGILEHKTY